MCNTKVGSSEIHMLCRLCIGIVMAFIGVSAFLQYDLLENEVLYTAAYVAFAIYVCVCAGFPIAIHTKLVRSDKVVLAAVCFSQIVGHMSVYAFVVHLKDRPLWMIVGLVIGQAIFLIENVYAVFVFTRGEEYKLKLRTSHQMKQKCVVTTI